jgi:serine/threonine protein kinase
LVGREKTELIREVESLAKLNHPNVLRIIGWTFPDNSHRGQIQTEYAPNGSLDRLLLDIREGEVRPSFWNAIRIGIVICGIVLGMRYIHKSGVIHGDLKPGNIVLNDKRYPLICDFGSSRFASDDATPPPATGTVWYAAPEQYSETAILTSKIDVFSFGLILYEIFFGCPVFSSSDSPFTVIQRLRSGDLPEVPSECGEIMQKLIRQCWETNPANRPSFDKILGLFRSHRFDILPNANATDIEAFCEAIIEWERRSHISK